MTTAPMPYVPILIALHDFLAAIPSIDFSVRHHRHRDTDKAELDIVSIQYVSCDPSAEFQGTANGASLAELVMDLQVNLIASAILSPEGDAARGVDDLDPTGLARPSAMLRTCIEALLPPEDPLGETLGGLLWMIRYDGSAGGDYDHLTPDSADLSDRLTLRYRVRAEAPTIL